MNPSESKLRKILGREKSLYHKIIDYSIDNPIKIDSTIGLLVVYVNYLLIKFDFQLFSFEKEDLNDILNELISSSLSAGGFVLAALAIIASIKQTIYEVDKNQKPRSGKEYFYNSIGYTNVLKFYSISCIVFLLGFILFSFLRGCSSKIEPFYLQGSTVFGIILISLTFLRCILMLWTLIRLK
jgi:hypothetical protein